MHHIFLRAVDGGPGTQRLGPLGFLRGTDHPDQSGTDGLGPLAGDRTDPASGGMEQHGLACLQRVGLAQQVLRGQALEHDGRRLFVADGLGQLHQMPCRQRVVLAIRAKRAGGVGHAVTDLQAADTLADRFDLASPFGAQTGRQARRHVETAAEIGIDEIQADGVVAYSNLPRSRRRDRRVYLFEDFGATVLAELYALRHIDSWTDAKEPIQRFPGAFVNQLGDMLAGPSAEALPGWPLPPGLCRYLPR